MTSNSYSTPEEILDFLNLSKEVPDYDNQVTTKETIGQADGSSATTYYLDHNKVINDTQTIFYGSGETTTTYLTETTHYTINNDRGSFVLNNSGATTASTANLYATYKYSSEWKNSVIQSMIDSKTLLINDLLDKDFTGLNVVVREECSGKGGYDRLYKVSNAPVSVFQGQLNGVVGSTATAFTLDSTEGLNAGDYCVIEEEAILVSSVTNSTDLVVSRAKLGTSGATHADDTPITNTVIEVSNTPVGSEPTWELLQYQSQFEVDKDTGAIQLLHVNSNDRYQVASDTYPTHKVFNRFRRTYTYGSSSVPEDIKNLCKLMVAKEMFNSQVLNALSRGTDGFETDSVNVINEQIDKLIAKNKRLLIDGN